MTTYRIVVHHPAHGTFYSEPWEMNDDVRKSLVENLRLCAKTHDVLSFDDDRGNTIIFPSLVECIVELRKEVKEDEQNEG